MPKHMLWRTEMDGKCQSRGWDLAAWVPLVAGGRTLEKVSGHVLLEVVNLCSPCVYPPCSRNPGLVLLPPAAWEVYDGAGSRSCLKPVFFLSFVKA